ncbi:hypothetical protein [Streptomyces sp. NPDC050535]
MGGESVLRLLRGNIDFVVLSRAVLWHAEDHVIRDGNRTIVFAR